MYVVIVFFLGPHGAHFCGYPVHVLLSGVPSKILAYVNCVVLILPWEKWTRPAGSTRVIPWSKRKKKQIKNTAVLLCCSCAVAASCPQTQEHTGYRGMHAGLLVWRRFYMQVVCTVYTACKPFSNWLAQTCCTACTSPCCFCCCFNTSVCTHATLLDWGGNVFREHWIITHSLTLSITNLCHYVSMWFDGTYLLYLIKRGCTMFFYADTLVERSLRGVCGWYCIVQLEVLAGWNIKQSFSWTELFGQN